jgi:hypothetical protein
MISAYYKTTPLFSRRKQEELVEKIDQELHRVMLSSLTENYSQGTKKGDFQKVSDWIDFSVSTYYLEKDLLDYLKALNEFISEYDQVQS